MKKPIRSLFLFILGMTIGWKVHAQTWPANLDVARMFVLNADNSNGVTGTVDQGGHIKVTVKARDLETIIYQVTLNASSKFFSGTGEFLEHSAIGGASTYYPARWNSKDIFTAVFDIDRYRQKDSNELRQFLKQPLPVNIIVEVVNAQLGAIRIPGIGIVNSSGGNALFDRQHDCYDLANNMASPCRIWPHIKQPNTSRSADLVAIAHRGIWGYDQGNGEPENSRLSIDATPAVTDIMESDVMQLKDLAELVVSHDYTLNRTSDYTGSNDHYFYQMTASQISGYNLRKRNTDVYANTHYLLFRECLEAVKTNKIVLTVDIKEQKARYDKNGQCIANCELYNNKTGNKEHDAQATLNIKNSYKAILAKCVAEAKAADALSYIAVKCPYDFDEVKDDIPVEDQGKILYFPVIQGDKKMPEALVFVDSWIGKAGNRLMGFETNFKDKSNTVLQPFTKDHKTYQNLWDYIYQSSGLRPAMYAEEPMGPRGIVDRWSEWMIKDLGRDIRGDHLQLMTIPYSNIMMITTDRPDLWIEMEKLYNH
jgi:hypothetical protein